MDAAHAERSKLIQKQKQTRTEAEKKVKKLKGLMKEAAQKELEELDSKFEAELAVFDKKGGTAGAKEEKKKEEKGGGYGAADDAPVAAEVTKFKDKNWNGLSKTECMEACIERGIGKNGKKEDLVSRLVNFQQDQAVAAANAPPPDPNAPKAKKPAKKAESSDEEDSDEDDDDEDDDDEDDDSDDDDDDDVDPEEVERQVKREKMIQKAVRCLLQKAECKDGFPASEFVTKLEMVNVKGFAPEKLGYKTVEKFLKGQPEKVLIYDKKEQYVLPPIK